MRKEAFISHLFHFRRADGFKRLITSLNVAIIFSNDSQRHFNCFVFFLIHNRLKHIDLKNDQIHVEIKKR